MAEESEGVEARVAKLAEARDQARATAAELRARVTQLETEMAPLRSASEALAAERASWARERAFLGVGLVDTEAQDVATLVHSRIPEAERPPLDVWLRELRADPAKAPKALAPYLAPAQSTTAGASAQSAAAGSAGSAGSTAATKRAESVETTASAGPSVTAAAIKAAAAEGLRTGDWSAYNALKAQLQTELSRR